MKMGEQALAGRKTGESRGLMAPSLRTICTAVLCGAGYIGLQRYWSTAIIAQRRVPGAIPPDWSHFDAGRAGVECFFGRLKRLFRILADDAYRLSWDKSHPTIALRAAVLNLRRRCRGDPLTHAPLPVGHWSQAGTSDSSVAGHASNRSHCPTPFPCTPTVHPADARAGLTPPRAFQIPAGRRAELRRSDFSLTRSRSHLTSGRKPCMLTRSQTLSWPNEAVQQQAGHPLIPLTTR